MHRFFVPFSNISDERIIIDDKAQAHHIKHVLRMKNKDKAVVFDEKGKEYDCLIENIGDVVDLSIQKRLSAPERNKFTITIACAIPKKSKFDDIVDKLTQLGVDRIIPLETERVIVKLDKRKEALRLARWKNIVLSASQQSQRNTLPAIEPLTPLKEVLIQSKGYDLKLIPTLLGERKSLKSISFSPQPKNILVFIGPEGDFSDKEIALAKQAGFIPVTLGDTVLRVETAAVAAMSMLKYALG